MSRPQCSDSGEANGTLEKKRARDRRSQQAMRDRVKTQLDELTAHVEDLKRRLDKEVDDVVQLQEQVLSLENENEYFTALNMTLRNNVVVERGTRSVPAVVVLADWQILPSNTPASNLVDTILGGVLDSRKKTLQLGAKSPAIAHHLRATPDNPYKPNFCALADTRLRAKDDLCNVVGDVLQSYKEINLPEKVGTAYLITASLLWRAQLDEYTWKRMPTWLRPIQKQLDVPHPAWIDQMPWPVMRDWLIDHPETVLAEFAFTYNSSFSVSWKMDSSHIIVALNESKDLTILNPVFEEHIRQLRNWDIGDKFRLRYPELGCLVDKSTANV